MPEDLLNTRWFLTRFAPNLQLHHVEVVLLLKGDQAVVVTCYSAPLLSWVIPIATIQMQPSAFTPLGHARDFDWVRPYAWVHQRTGENATSARGTWLIESVDSWRVHFRERHYESNRSPTGVESAGPIVDWNDFLTRFRQATNEEIQAYRADQGRFQVTLEEPAAPPPTVDPDAGLFSFTLNSEGPAPAPRPTRWERLDGEDD